MPNSLPIYDNIVSKINSDDIQISTEDKDNLIANINTYRNTHELLFAIIRYYQLNNSSNITTIPFYSKYLKTKNGYKFDIDNIPNKLLKIMIEFYNLHIKSIENA